MANKHGILVTGATGFIGRHLCPSLDKKGYKIYPLSLSLGFNLCDAGSFYLFKAKKIKTVIHLAGKTFVPDSWKRFNDFYSTNVTGTMRVLDFCSSENAKLIYVSGYIYGLPKYLPIDEAHPIEPNNPYAHSKWIGEEMCKFYAEQKKVKVIILRPFNLYGAGQDERFLIPSIIKQIKSGQRIRIKDSRPKRDMLYIDDFLEACFSVLDYDSYFDIFNVGSGASFSVKEIVEVAIAASGKKIKWDSLKIRRCNEIPETVADIRHIMKKTGWKPKFSLKKGLMDTLSKEGYYGSANQSKKMAR